MTFKDLESWQLALDLAKEIYRLTENFPRAEMFGLTSQFRRASTGILADIAEGFSRNGDADKSHKYTIARGECSEVNALLHVSVAVGRLTLKESEFAEDLSQQVGRLLSGLIRRFSRLNPQP